MKVIVMKCSFKDVWWKDHIGKVLPVKIEGPKDYSVLVNKNKTEKILKSDCEVVER